MTQGVTFDAGALISLERRKDRARRVYQRLRELDVQITVPLVAVGEWWRGQTRWRDNILASMVIDPLSLASVMIAGEALAILPTRRRRRPGLLDAIVMASAASRGDVVYTTDVSDLQQLQSFFPAVRVLGL